MINQALTSTPGLQQPGRLPSVWPFVVAAGLLRGLVGSTVFFNLFLQMPLGVIPFVMSIVGGLLGNLLFVGVVGLLFSLITGAGTRPYRVYARSFWLAVPAYLLILPVLILTMPVLPADASFTTTESARQVVLALRATLPMELYRYTQLVIFVAQLVYMIRVFRLQLPTGRLLAAAITCLLIYCGLFFTRVI